MKKSVILLIVLAGILGTAYYKKSERNSRLNRSTSSVKTRELLLPDLDINGIKKIHIKEGKSEATLTVQNDTWVVAERGGYPVNKETLQAALMSLKYEKIKAGRRIGKESWGKVGVNSPGDATATGTGTLVELFDDKGALKHSFVLGGTVTSSGGSNNDQMSMFGGPTGNRFVRIKDEDTLWEVGNQFSELATKPDAWLQKSFIDVQKIKSVEVTAATPADSWKASRADENATEFVLEGAKPGEKIDSGKATLASLLSSPQFNDVKAKDQAAETMKGAVKVKIITFDGFTYNLQVAKLKVDSADKYYLTVAVSADLPKERAPVKDEKDEDKKKNDTAFAEEKKQKEEKLANEKQHEGWVYEVSEYAVSTLLKKRSEILAEAPKEPAGDTPPPAAGRMPGLPDVKRMIPGLPNATTPPPPAVTTPPVEVPAPAPAPAPEAAPMPKAESSTPPALTKPAPTIPEAPKVELKPAAPPPAPEASPPAAPAPPPAPEPAKPAPETVKPAPEPAKPAPVEEAKK